MIQDYIDSNPVVFFKLKRDIMIKLLLSSNINILKWFIERCLNIKIDSIKIKDKNNYTKKSIDDNYILKLLDKELSNNTVFNKTKIVDLLIEVDNTIIDLEVNSVFSFEEKKRNVAYLSNLYSNNIFRGEEYSKKGKSIQLNLCWDLGDEYSYFDHDIYRIRSEKYNDTLVDNYEIQIYNIDFYKKEYYNKSNKKLIDKYKHIIMLDCDLYELKKLSKGDEIMKEIYEKTKHYNNIKNIFRYISLEDDYKFMMNTKLRNAREEGIEEGVKEGVKEGIRNTAINLLKEHISINIISKTTGLSCDYIKSLNQK